MRIGNLIRQKRKGYRVIVVGILLFLQCTIIIFVDADPSQGRWGHASVLINNRLYVYGGRTDQLSPGSTSSNINELIYLDVSKPFGPVAPPWVVNNSSLPSGNASPFLSFHSCSFGGSQNELLILFGGESRDQEITANSLFSYNTTAETWLDPPAESIPRRARHTIVTILDKPIAYLWGGTPVGDGENVRAINDLYKLDINTVSWELLATSTESPAGRWDHSATLLNDGKMYIIGGVLPSENGGIKLASMEEIPVYDTNLGTWTTQTAIGDIPTSRRAHQAVGTARIIIYGGSTAEFDQKFDDIAELKEIDGILKWAKPQVSGTVPPGRFSHSMILAGSKAIVTFGFVDDFTGTKLFVLDIDSFTWDSSYSPSGLDSAPTGTTNPSNPNSGGKKGMIIGVSVGGGVLVLVIGGLLLFYCIRRRRHQLSFSATPYEKHQASIPPIAGPAPSLHGLNNYSPSPPSQGGAGGSTNNPLFTPPFVQRRQSSFGSISEKRNLTPVEQHDSWGSAPSNSSQSQLPQINPNIPYYEANNYYQSPSPYLITTPNVPPSPQLHHHYYSNTPPTPPPSTPTPPPASPQRDLFPTDVTAGTTSSSNLRLNSDSNTAPVEFDLKLPPVPPLSINRARPSSPQTQAQQLPSLPPRLPISTTTSSSSLLQDSSNDLISSPTEMEATETIPTENRGLGGSFNSPLFRTEALSAFAGTAAAASPTDRQFSLRSVPRINTSTPRNSTSLSSSPIPAGGRSTLDGQHIYSNDDGTTGSSRPTSPTDNNSSDNQPSRGRLFVANPDPSDESD